MRQLSTLLKPFSFLPALLMLYIIFSFSAQSGTESEDLSYRASKIIIKTADKAFDMDWTEEQVEYYTDGIHYYVRKLAHVTEYFLLAVSVSFPLYVYGLHGIPLMIIAGSFCVGAACLDEYHQSFVALRGPSPRDVLIDSIGILIGIFLVRIFCYTVRTVHQKKRR